MNLSKYIIKTKKSPEEEVLLNTVNKRFLPLTATEQELGDNYFLQGQEEECLNDFLLGRKEKAIFTIVPTWRCNLRCSHCSVLHLLEKEDSSKIDKAAFKNFFDSYFAKMQPKHVVLLYVGGESMLEVDQCVEFQDIVDDLAKKHHVNLIPTMTTNLAYELTAKHIDFFRRLVEIQISVDGNKEQHNKQRKVFDKKELFDCYERTILNINKMVRLGLREVMCIQSAIKDEYLTVENRNEFYKVMLRIGIKFDSIKYCGIHPTVLNPKLTNAAKSDVSRKEIRNSPCCKYRYFSNFQINPDNSLYDNVYIREISKLGTIYDDLGTIKTNHAEIIKNSMPVLKDETCQKCPVIGYCWGGCTNEYVALGNNPSKFCNQQGLIDIVKEYSDKGELFQLTVN